ncbi:unnamed protein product [Sphagnum troendelagicum]
MTANLRDTRSSEARPRVSDVEGEAMETGSMCLQPMISGWTIATSPTATTASLTPFMAPRPSPFPTTILPITIR